MRAQHQLLGWSAGGQLLVLLHCTEVGLDDWHYENRSTFFSLMPGNKEKKLFSKCSFWFFENKLVKAVFSQGAMSKQLHFKNLHEKQVLPFRYSIFLWRHIQGTTWTWKLAKCFHKSRFSCDPRPQKWSNGLICSRICQCQHACQGLAYVFVLFGS